MVPVIMGNGKMKMERVACWAMPPRHAYPSQDNYDSLRTMVYVYGNIIARGRGRRVGVRRASVPRVRLIIYFVMVTYG